MLKTEEREDEQRKDEDEENTSRSGLYERNSGGGVNDG